MSKIKVFVPYGALGTGITEEAFARGMELSPDIIAFDAGSTDSGAYYLGTATKKYADSSVEADLRRAVVGGSQRKIPVLIGSAGTCGADQCVDELCEMCVRICREEGLSGKKIATIYTQQNVEILKKRLAEEMIKPLEAAPIITEDTLERCTNIVALAGPEPFQEALKAGADIVICGRATDTAIIAAYPLMKGCDTASCWHGAKVSECGSLCTTNPQGGGVFVTFDETGFEIEPTALGSACTIYSVSAHMLYENSDPYVIYEPPGHLDVRECRYTQLDDSRVRVENSKFFPSKQYSMKLEGSAPLGYQTISLTGIRDRRIMRDPQSWMNNVMAAAANKLERYGINHSEYTTELRPYGWNAVSGEKVPENYLPHELGMLLIVTAETQKKATQIAKVFNPLLLHCPVSRDEQMPTFAFPFSPAEIERGPIYEFMLHHIVLTSDPFELVRTKFVETEGAL